MQRSNISALAIIAAVLNSQTTAAEISPNLKSPPTYFVNGAGSDANNGLSPTTAFKTLQQAQKAMRLSAIKVATVLPGTYSADRPIVIDSRDAHTVWLSAVPRAAVLDGESKVPSAFTLKRAHFITIKDFTITRTLRDGIGIASSTDVTILGNDICDVASTGWSQGGIHLSGSNSRVHLEQNDIRRTGYDGILVETRPTDALFDIVVESNILVDTCSSVPDCGGVHINDRGHTAHNIVISGNTIHNSRPPAASSKAIYLDDELSNALVSKNQISGFWLYAFQIHGGDHNFIVSNTVYATHVGAMGLYQGASPFPDFGMAENTFRQNQIFYKADYQLQWKKISFGADLVESQNSEQLSSNPDTAVTEDLNKSRGGNSLCHTPR